MDLFQNLDLLSIGITTAAIGILGFIVFLNNTKSATNRAFLLLSITAILWSTINYLSYQFSSPVLTLWLLRFIMFFAVWYSFSLFLFFYIFPKEHPELPKKYKFLTVSLAIFTSFLTLSPFVLSGIKELMPPGQVSVAQPGPGIFIFGITVLGFIGSGVVILVKKIQQTSGVEKTQSQLILLGAVITFSLYIVFNFILAAFFDNPQFIPFGAVFTFPLIAFTAYAVIKHRLFNVKVVATEVLIFILAVTVLFEAVSSKEPLKIASEFGIFILVLIFGALLIRSVRKEVKQREQVEILAKDLQIANDKLKELDDLKTDFISIASHQLRTPLTAIKGYSSMIMEGTYGDSSLQIKGVVDKIFQSAQRLIYIVNDLLDVSRIEQGRFTVAFEETKLANVIRDVTEELKTSAEKKNITLSFEVGVDDAEIKINADFNKIRQVFTNLVDNALKYTNTGYVKVTLEAQGDKALVSVKDSGIGISATTIPNLFQKFTRAKGIAKLHTDGTGLGLYVAHEIVKAHQGKVWVESEGEGKGSQFYVLLPLKNSKSKETEQFIGGGM